MTFLKRGPFKALCLQFIAVLALVATTAYAKKNPPNSDTGFEEEKTISLSELSHYYQKLMPYLQLNDRATPDVLGAEENSHDYSRSVISYKLDDSSKWNLRFVPASGEVFEFRTNEFLFTTDVLSYNQFFGGENFLDAKRLAYTELEFNEKRQQYQRKVPYVSYWTGLNHAPIRELESDELSTYSDKFPDHNGESPLITAQAQKKLSEVSKTELTVGNKMVLLPNESSVERRIKLVKNAKEYFFASVMYFQCKGKSGELIDAMIDASENRGVDVRFIVEGVFTVFETKCLKKMKRAGISILKPFTFLNPKHLFSVMHTKVWIADGKKAVLGGQNLLNQYAEATGFNHQNRDTDVFVEGPTVTDITHQYLNMWIAKRSKKKKFMCDGCEGQILRDYRKNILAQKKEQRRLAIRGANFINQFDDKLPLNEGVCRSLLQTPGNEVQSDIGKTLYESLKLSSHSLVFTTPNLSYIERKAKEHKRGRWNHKIMKELIAKSDDGFKSTMLSNGFWGGVGEFSTVFRHKMEKALDKGKSKMAKFWERRYFRSDLNYAKGGIPLFKGLAQNTNLDIWTYFQYTHQKVFLFDQIMSVIGSFNMDAHSSRNNYEISMFCLDEDLAGQLKRQLTLDLVNSIPVWPYGNAKNGRDTQKIEESMRQK
ncbi:MAG: phosphatidylserine/phosphatidylglycerophosphate/cardiolipin synthase family protein [Bacteriovoracaceae bacterium]|jgi:phosphatidylserine/phosphatidylglycerophosphate/cardiolipin synthase-like enzyme|nr:phosphatidylserine/phosphatidylglycerophosphate/cardiolipin synthase family protein [Bacteriovoracaceae bacterium]